MSPDYLFVPMQILKGDDLSATAKVLYVLMLWHLGPDLRATWSMEDFEKLSMIVPCSMEELSSAEEELFQHSLLRRVRSENDSWTWHVQCRFFAGGFSEPGFPHS